MNLGNDRLRKARLTAVKLGSGEHLELHDLVALSDTGIAHSQVSC